MSLDTLWRTPAVRQALTLLALSASVAIGFAIVLWARTPNHAVLFGNLSQIDQARIVDELVRLEIPYRINTGTGVVTVPAKQLDEARLKIAAAGLPWDENGSLAALGSSDFLGSSEIHDLARYQHALESELARTLQSINSVQSVRVHLALPKQSAFLRDRQQPSASVMLRLHAGRVLDDGFAAAIRNLVAASVPALAPERVTIVDQAGRLLGGIAHDTGLDVSSAQMEYRTRVEQLYVDRITDLITPMVGPGGVRAQVSLDLDFTVTESTAERYDPDAPVMRSEQLQEERTMPGTEPAGGVPGALSNQPPPAGAFETDGRQAAAAAAPGPVDAQTTGVAVEAVAREPEESRVAQNTSMRATRNFEIDKTISHSREAPGRLLRVSAAVILDDKLSANEAGEPAKVPFTEEELARITALVREVIGYDESRGDSLQVVNSPFRDHPAEEPLPEPSLLEAPWIWDLAKHLAGAIGFLILIFGIFRPLLNSISISGRPPAQLPAGVAMLDGPAPVTRRIGIDYAHELSTAKTLASQDPKRAAQVVRTWVSTDA
jgi:flagellar M-ring protein FliF